MSFIAKALGLSSDKSAEPAEDPAKVRADQENTAATEQTRRLLRGRTSTMLTGSLGVTGDASSTSKTLLGQ